MKVLKPLGFFAVLVFVLIGCKSDGGRAVVDDQHPTTTDTGPLHAGTTGGDAAGTLNFQGGHDAPEHGNFVPVTGGSATSGGEGAGASKTASSEGNQQGGGGHSEPAAAPEGH